MKNKSNSFFAFLLAALILGSFAAASAQQARKPALSPPQNTLIQSLPASDAVVSFDAQKFLNNALPQLLGADSSELARINAHLDQIKGQTGIDLRQFESAAAGLKYKQVAPNQIDIEPVILVRGKFNPGAILALVKIAVNGKYREEQIGGRTVYVLQLKEIFTESAQKQPPSSVVEKMMEKILRTFSGELAVGALNDKTLAIGSVARVQDTFSGASALSPELKAVANAKPGAILNFAANTPAGLSKIFGMDNDEFGKLIDSVKLLFGYVSISAAGNASLMVTAKTGTVEQATNLENTMNGLKEVGKMLIGGIKGNEKQIFLRMVDNARIGRTGSFVQLSLLIPQSDLSALTKKL